MLAITLIATLLAQSPAPTIGATETRSQRETAITLAEPGQPAEQSQAVKTEANRETLRQIFDGLVARDGTRFWEALSDDAVWIGPGDSDWAGPFHGKAEIRDRLIRPLRARIGAPRSVPDRILVDGDWAAVQFHGDNETVDGQRYDNRYVFIFRFEAGRIVEITEYMDTEMAERVLGSHAAALVQ